MDFLLVGLVTYIIYIPVFCVLLVLAIKKYRGYSIFKHLVSELGEERSPAHAIFNLALSVFGILSLFFVLSLANLLPAILLSKIGLIFLLLTCVSTAFLGLFPRDRASKHHAFFGPPMFFGVAGSALFLIYPIYSSKVIPDLIIAVNSLILVAIGLLTFAGWLSDKKKKGLGGFNKFIVKNMALWEWLAFVSAVFWDFSLAWVTLLKRI